MRNSLDFCGNCVWRADFRLKGLFMEWKAAISATGVRRNGRVSLLAFKFFQ
jgi:hypothetical protein